MKSVRNELVSSAVGSYLKRRQYSEGETYKKGDLKHHHSLHEMALQGVVEAQTSSQNVIAFSSSEVSDWELVDQYEKLKVFISEAPEPYKSQLSYFLCPMFIELYVELRTSGHLAPARKLYENYHNLFKDAEGYSNFVEVLPTISAQDMSTHANVMEFQKIRHKVVVSKDCMEYLMRYLKEAQLVTFMDLINMCFDVEVFDEQQSCDVQLFDDGSPEDNVTIEIPSEVVKTPEKSPSASADALAALMQAIKNVSDGPPCRPSVCLYSVSGGHQKLIDVDISSKSVLATSFDDSSIRLWNLEPTPFTSRPAVVDISKIHLACDDVEEEQRREADTTSVMKTLRGHGGPVYGLSFFPRHDLLLSCSEDTTVRTWSMETHKNLAIYQGHNYPIWDIDTSRFGLYFATASKDRTARLFTLDKTFPQRMFVGHSEDVDSVKFHPNASYLATGSSDRTVRLWCVQSGKLLRVFHGHKGSIYALAFSPDGQCLASAGEDRRIKVWDLNTSGVLKELRGHTDIVYSLCFSGDGSLLASCGMEQSVRVWDVRRSGGHPAPPPLGNAGNEGHTSPEMLASYPTKTSSNHRFVRFTKKNLLFAVGVAGSSSSNQ